MDSGSEAAVFDDKHVQEVRTRTPHHARDAVARTRVALEADDKAAATAGRRPRGCRRGRKRAAVVAETHHQLTPFDQKEQKSTTISDLSMAAFYPVAASTRSASSSGRSLATAASNWPPSPLTVLLDTIATHRLQNKIWISSIIINFFFHFY